jgi:hypothetical protein
MRNKKSKGCRTKYGFKVFMKRNETGVAVHICNPSYSGGEAWEDYNSSQPQQKVSETHISISIKSECGGSLL